MTELYTVRFTTKKMVKKLDAKGKIIAETSMDTPITMHMLPYSAAMSYSGADNFQIERYVSDDRYASKGKARPAGVGNGYKDRFASVSSGEKQGRDLAKGVVAKKATSNSTFNAAAAGDLSAALNR